MYIVRVLKLATHEVFKSHVGKYLPVNTAQNLERFKPLFLTL